MGERRYSAATEAAIFAMSLKCYYPGCPVASVSIFKDGTEAKNVQIAHIVAVSPKGPRYRELPEGETNRFTNLILLCTSHHSRVDKKANADKYPEPVLRRWKQENEHDLRSKVDGLDKLTEDELNNHLNEAAAGVKEEIEFAIKELKDHVSESSAELLRSLYNKIVQHYINADSVDLLFAASERLTNLEDNAEILFKASDHLVNLEDNSATLSNAADQLVALDLSKRAEQLVDLCGELGRTLSKQPNVPDIAGSIEQAGDSAISAIEARAKSIDLGEPPNIIDDAQRWNFAFRGFAAGVAACIIFGVCMLIWFNGPAS